MMTVPQKKYFCTRIDEITAQKVNELKDVNSAGNKEVLLGWSTRNSANEQPANYWNPSERSARNRDRTTNITIMETFGNTTLIT